MIIKSMIVESVVLAIMTGISAYLSYKKFRKTLKSKQNKFSIQLIFGKHPDLTYVPWFKKEYKNNDAYEFDIEQLFLIFQNQEKNSFLKDAGLSGISIWHEDKEFFSVMTSNK